MDKLEEVLFKATGDRLVGQFLHDELMTAYPELSDYQVQTKLADFITDVPAQKADVDAQEKAELVQKQQFGKVAFLAKMAGCVRQFKEKENSGNSIEETFESKAKRALKMAMPTNTDEQIEDILNLSSPDELQGFIDAFALDNEKTQETMKWTPLSDSSDYTDIDSVIDRTYSILSEFAERKNTEEEKLNLNWKPILVGESKENKEAVTIDSIAMQGAQIFINNDGAETMLPMIAKIENMDLEEKEKQADEVLRLMTSTGKLEDLDSCLYSIDIHRKLASSLEIEYGKIAATKEVADSTKAAELIDKYPVMAAFAILHQDGQKFESVEQFEEKMDSPEVLRLTRKINDSNNKIDVNKSVFEQIEGYVESGYKQINGYSMEA